MGGLKFSPFSSLCDSSLELNVMSSSIFIVLSFFSFNYARNQKCLAEVRGMLRVQVITQ